MIGTMGRCGRSCDLRGGLNRLENMEISEGLPCDREETKEPEKKRRR